MNSKTGIGHRNLVQQKANFVFLCRAGLSHLYIINRTMKKIIAHFILNICLVLIPFGGMLAQGWERVLSSFGQEELLDLVPHPDGGYLAVGSFNAQNRIYLVKTFADGNRQWSRELGSVMKTAGRSLVILPTGEILIGGFADGFGSNGRDFTLTKTDAEGHLLWQKNYGGAHADEANDLTLTADGGLLLTGFTNSSAGDKDILLVKTDADGIELWKKTKGTYCHQPHITKITAVIKQG